MVLILTHSSYVIVTVNGKLWKVEKSKFEKICEGCLVVPICEKICKRTWMKLMKKIRECTSKEEGKIKKKVENILNCRNISWPGDDIFLTEKELVL